MDKKRVLITGITGFAGSHLAELLIADNQYIVSGTHVSDRHLDNIASIKDLITLYKVNLLDSEETIRIIGESKPDIIFHLAASTSVAESFKKPAEVITNNAASQVNVLEAVRVNNLNSSRIVITSSAHVYGYILPEELPIDESVSFKPDNPYSVSKITQDYLGLSYFNAYKLSVIRVRPFNHIGARLSPEISISRFAKIIAEIEKGKAEPILKVGNLSAKRDFTDVRDMVRAYKLAAEYGKPGEAYNLGTGTSYSIQEMLDQLLQLSTTKITIETDQSLFRPSDIPELRCNPGKFQQTTGWKPEVAVEDTLKDVLDYWRKVV